MRQGRTQTRLVPAPLAGLFAAALAGGALSPARAEGLQYQFGELNLGLTGMATLGAAWRMQDRDVELLGKTNVPGQQTLCDADDCMSLAGDPAPNQRLVDARGSLSGTNGDNGNLNYDLHDPIAAVTKLTPTLSASWGNTQAKLRGILFYDAINADFDEQHSNTLYQPAETAREDDIERRFGKGFKLREAFVSTVLPLGDNEISIGLGRQIMTWGEANLTLFNTLNVINPPDAGSARMPGFQINEVFQPVPMLTLGTALTDALSVEAFYQFGWEPAEPDPAGSFFSINDVAGGGDYFLLGLGQFSEDPDRQFRPAGLASLLSQSSRTALVLDEEFGYPEDGGQYGAAFKYFAADFNGGTEFGLYFANYHSRLPYLSAYAADASCTRDAAVDTFLLAFVACNGFNAAFNPIGREPLPVETLRPFLDYPEDIRLYGLSFNTNVGDWSLAGEYAWRPDMPLQVHLTDVIFAGLSPAFPRSDIPIPADLGGGVNEPFTIPGEDHAVPDFLSRYRGVEIGAGDLVRGYEKFKVGQFTLTGIRTFGASNPLRADQILFLVEASLTHIEDLPGLDELQLEGAGERTHYSPGADGTGSGGTPDALRVNPTRQTEGFATDFSWGYRVLTRFSYNDVYRGINLFPALILFHDVKGVSPGTIDNYLEGRKLVVGTLDFEFSASLSAGLQYQLFAGAGERNLRHDRDNLSVNLRYSF